MPENVRKPSSLAYDVAGKILEIACPDILHFKDDSPEEAEYWVKRRMVEIEILRVLVDSRTTTYSGS